MDKQSFNNDFHYQSITGKLNFLEKSTRPDISYAVHQCVVGYTPDRTIEVTIFTYDLSQINLSYEMVFVRCVYYTTPHPE